MITAIETDVTDNASRITTLETANTVQGGLITAIETDLDSNANKIQFITSTTDSTVITSNLDITGNIFMRGDRFVVESETKLINDAVIGLANNNTTSTTDTGFIMQRPEANVALIHHGASGSEYANHFTIGYTQSTLTDADIGVDTANIITVNIIGNLVTQNTITASYLHGDASNVTAVPATQITGTLDVARIPSLAASKITSGTLGVARIPSLAATKITTGTLDVARIPSLAASKITSGTLDAARIPTLNQNTTGSAGSAATLTTPRSIGGVNFDGSVDITPTTFTAATFSGSGPVINCTASNPGDMISKRYASADRYGMGQYAGGITRLFTSTAYSSGRICFSGATDDVTGSAAAFTDYVTIENDGNVGIGTTSPGGTLHVQADNRVHITAGTVPAFTGMSAVSEGRSQLVLNSRYSDLVIASSYANDNHGSTLSFAAVNPSNTAEYRKFVINQGNWGSRKDFLDFGLSASAADPNPHSSINSTDTVLTLDGNNKRVGIGTTTPTSTLDVNGVLKVRGGLAYTNRPIAVVGRNAGKVSTPDVIITNVELYDPQNCHNTSNGRFTVPVGYAGYYLLMFNGIGGQYDVQPNTRWTVNGNDISWGAAHVNLGTGFTFTGQYARLLMSCQHIHYLNESDYVNIRMVGGSTYGQSTTHCSVCIMYMGSN